MLPRAAKTSRVASKAARELVDMITDREHEIRQMIARVARSEARSALEDYFERKRAELESDPVVKAWMARQRELMLAGVKDQVQTDAENASRDIPGRTAQ